MRHIKKNVAPGIFRKWMELESEEWQPSYVNLQNPEKLALHESLLTEQNWTCCYCGQSIELANSHIEHFRPQESRRDLALDYENLLASCGRVFEKTTPSHCGNAKSNQFDEQLHISPLEQACESRFIYTLNGQICATDPNDLKAGYMTGLLDLDIPFLRNRREEAVKRVFDEEFLASATNEILVDLIRGFRSSDPDGKIDDLAHVIARFAEQQMPG